MDPEVGRQSSNSGVSTPALREPERAKLRPRSLRRLRPFAPFVALVVLSLLVGALNPRFFEFNNVVRIANSAAIPLVLALGETFVIILGSVDLSVEGVLAVGAVVISLLVRNDSNANALGWTGAALAIAICAGIGCLSGLIHVQLRIPSFMATLGHMVCRRWNGDACSGRLDGSRAGHEYTESRVDPIARIPACRLGCA